MKFMQNPELASKLKNTRGLIVECNPKDLYFSCGLAITHPDTGNTSKWKGKNVLGEVLCTVRDTNL